MTRRFFISVFALFLFALITPAASADFFGAFGVGKDAFEESFALDAGWDPECIKSYRWTGLDGKEHVRRSSGYQKEAFDDSVEALVKELSDRGFELDLSEGHGLSPTPGVSSGVSVSLETGTVQDACFLFLTRELSMSVAGACGVLGNLQVECGWNITAVGDGGTSFGLCQWHSERWQALTGFCSQRGLDSLTLEGQLAYLAYELTSTSESSVLPLMKSAPDTPAGAASAALSWASVFERCSPDSYLMRQNLARGFFESYFAATA